MNFGDILSKLLGNQEVSPEHKAKMEEQLKTDFKKEMETPPVIALIGLSGVGKSSTINALFGTKLAVSHFESCTKEGERLSLKGEKGDIIVYDMPGLGEGRTQDEKHKKTYFDILPKCDVVLWVMVAHSDGRGGMTFSQDVLENVVAKACDLRRLVIGVNQADLMQPLNWIEKANIPSKEQENYLEMRIKDVRAKLLEVAPNLPAERIIYYSAQKRYRLEQLFSTLMDACADERAWVLKSRAHIADYTELIDPEILQLLKSK